MKGDAVIPNTVPSYPYRSALSTVIYVRVDDFAIPFETRPKAQGRVRRLFLSDFRFLTLVARLFFAGFCSSFAFLSFSG